jgi:hypothetical protein
MTFRGVRWILLVALVAASPLTHAETRWERQAREKREMTQNVIWPSHEPLMFSLRRGNHPEDLPEIYERQHSPENIEQMAKAGVRFGRLHFYKGLGLVMEADEMRKSQQMADLMHKFGMKVSLYVAGTMFAETFYREVPEAESWEQRDQNNRFVPYMETQTYRHYPCPNEPAYRAYLKQVLRRGVESFHAEQVFFDNVQLQPEPKSCRDARCINAFKEYLRRKYPTPEAVRRRFGYPSVDYLHVNEWEFYNRPEDLMTIDDPVLQEWVRFRCESLARHNIDLGDFVKSLDPGISVGFNLKGLYGVNRMWLNGIYHPLYAGHSDFMTFDVGGMDSRIEPKTGALISEIRSYKMARQLKMTCHDSLDDDLHSAVHMAFNYQKYLPRLGYQGGFSEWGGTSVFTPFAEFFREYNDRYFTGTDNVADVAVLRSWPSMAYSVGPTLVPTILMEQILIQHKAPFDILFDENIDRIDRYGALILPGQESLSKEIVERVIQYVRNGGTLVFTGNTADYNEWREARRTNPLRSLMQTTGSAPSISRLGKGRLVYIPAIIPALAPGQSTGVDNPEIIPGGAGRKHEFPATEWVLPKNHEEVWRTITENLPHGLSVTTGAPLTTVMEIVNRAKSRETIVYFVNFDRHTRLKPFDVSLRRQFPGKVKSVTWFSPESDDPKALGSKDASGRISFNVPSMGVFSMVVVAHEEN